MAIFNPVTRGKIFVILPALNEEEALRRLLPDIHHATDMMRTAIHVIVIDDGSTDRTADATQWAPEGLSVEVIRHGENRGLAGGLTTGISRVLEASEGQHDLMVCMDADHTHPPESIPKMAALIWEGEDIVIASRYQPGSRQKGVPRFRRFLSWGAKTLFRLLLPIPGVRDYTCGFRAYRVAILREAWRRTDGHLITTEGFACTDELLVKLALITDNIREIPFTLRYDRKPGKSKLQLGVTIRAQLRVLKHLRRLRRAGLPD
jgi:dolichol-phosphate mannosyltransferase